MGIYKFNTLAQIKHGLDNLREYAGKLERMYDTVSAEHDKPELFFVGVAAQRNAMMAVNTALIYLETQYSVANSAVDNRGWDESTAISYAIVSSFTHSKAYKKLLVSDVATKIVVDTLFDDYKFHMHDPEFIPLNLVEGLFVELAEHRKGSKQ